MHNACMISANVTAHPIVFDDDEDLSSPSLLESTPTLSKVHDDLPSEIDADFQIGTQCIDRPIRKKRKRCSEGMQAWGSTDFQQSEVENLQNAWLDVQTRWLVVEDLLHGLKTRDPSLEQAIGEFNATWSGFCLEVSQDGLIDPLSIADLVASWQKVEKILRNAQGHGETKSSKFRLSLNWLWEKTLLCDCIEEFSDSADRKDEDKDKDYDDEKIVRPYKSQRRR